MLRTRPLTLFLGVLAVAVGLGCGAGSTDESQDDSPKTEPVVRAYVAQIPRTQPPPISAILKLRRDGQARLSYQLGGARPFRDERGRWETTEEGVVLHFKPSDHVEGPLPSPIPMRAVGQGYTVETGILADVEVSFLPYRKAP